MIIRKKTASVDRIKNTRPIPILSWIKILTAIRWNIKYANFLVWAYLIIVKRKNGITKYIASGSKTLFMWGTILTEIKRA
jgi:hypothetical protein